jgi:hypothetical protein
LLIDAEALSTSDGNEKRLKGDLSLIEQLLTTVHVLTESVCKPDNQQHVDVDAMRQTTKSLQNRFDVRFVSVLLNEGHTSL